MAATKEEQAKMFKNTLEDVLCGDIDPKNYNNNHKKWWKTTSS